MIDWAQVIRNSTWIAGLATVLAVLSCADWRASAERVGLRAVVKRVSQSAGFALGMTLVCLGAGLGVSRLWECILWLLLAASFASQAGWTWLKRRKEPPQ